MLVGKVLRSPHAHARIRAIDTSKAAALPGVKAVVTRDDFPDLPSEFVPAGEMLVNYRDMVRNVMAREKVLYEGHAVAAVAATERQDRQAGAQADRGRVRGAAARDRRRRGDEGRRADPARGPVHRGRRAGADQALERRPSGSSSRSATWRKGFAQAELIVEREFDTKPVHQGYIEPHACVASVSEDGQAESGAAPRATSWSAPTAPSCSASTSPRSGSARPRSAAASAARRSSISSRWRWRCRRRRASRSRW